VPEVAARTNPLPLEMLEPPKVLMAKKIRLSTLAKVQALNFQRAPSGAASATVRDSAPEAFTPTDQRARFRVREAPLERRIASFANRRRNK